MAKQAKGKEIVVGFNYDILESPLADQVRASAQRIKEKVKRTIENIIEVGKELLAVKKALPHGHFLPWLKAEFGWTERTARNFMAVAERFGPKTEMISDLQITPTAAYALAAPSAPDEARQAAIERAEAGERITKGVAENILTKFRKRARRKGRTITADEMGKRLFNALERYKELCDAEKRAELARQLREFADALEEQ